MTYLPYVAIGFRSMKSNGSYRYVWLYKGKFIDPEDNNETKGDSINFQSETISGQFVKLANEVTVEITDGTVKTHPWKYEIDEDTDTADATTVAGWFEDVVMPAVS